MSTHLKTEKVLLVTAISGGEISFGHGKTLEGGRVENVTGKGAGNAQWGLNPLTRQV
ncbi:hypothetical protein [Asticcacaulis sp.]|uniref:hypothetical protein n=1 Tax=Asticcacaulis sp. TaxID=1872648 RepID=UPI002601D281|nr:hypothetical protein [Asticcacaulis sp.]